LFSLGCFCISLVLFYIFLFLMVEQVEQLLLGLSKDGLWCIAIVGQDRAVILEPV
jgi:hypothetical protein